MTTSGPRAAAPTVRPTLRCLADDLKIPVPPPALDLGELEHKVLKKGRELATSYPQGQVRVASIDDATVFRFTHGRNRALTWYDESANVIWVCAVDLREDDTYDEFLRLHERNQLLASEADYRRREVESAYTLVRAIRAGAPQWLHDACTHPAEERRHRLPGGAEILLYIIGKSGVEEIWLAMPTLTAPPPTVGLAPRTRALIAAQLELAIGESEWEQRYDWPTARLQHYEVAYLGLH